ncbi:WbqC family protein [Mycobacterium marinum]|uniref:WbqC family protein n=1 Tax=Mycobacterium marinum TaxID=1781 RepID=UPI000E3C627E|nr:WbqC family protein [Mycobacterium marinum]
MKKVAIVQSNYVPWRGYFDMIAFVDEFIIYDDMQYTKRDWRNRNRIKTSQGLQWITVPVQVKGRFHQKIRETLIDGTDWAKAHWRALEFNYGAAHHYAEIADWLAPIYLDERYEDLSSLNRRLLEAICGYLGIVTRLTNSWDYTLAEGKTERLADLCQQAEATEYVSGPAARSYVDEHVFDELGIQLTWFDYEGYRDYTQLWGAFEPAVTILDLLFNMGPEAPDYLRYCRR